MVWKKDDPQGGESHKISWEIVKWTRGKVLDIGAGLSRTFPHFITVDNNADAVLFGHQMPRPDVFVDTAEKLPLFADNSVDAVFSSHLLEHIAPGSVTETLREWLRVVKVGGYLVLYLPDEDQYPKVGEPGANPDHKWNVNYEALVSFMRGTRRSWDLVDFQRRDQGNEYSLLFVFKKLSSQKDEGFSYSWKDYERPVKTAGVVRYGAYGDLMQASSVLKALKEQGFHVTLYTSQPGVEVIENDPHIDEFYLQDKDQVPNQALAQFWQYHAKKYDRWVNLSESVEGTLLTIRNRIVDEYAPSVRHALCDRNYLEHQHLVAQVPYEPTMKFYPTEEEKKWAKEERAKYGPFCLVWSLGGSSVNKHWPWVDQALSGLLLDFPEVQVVLVGGPDGVILEQGWEKTPRVHCRSGKWAIRRTLAFTQLADAVVGPETGVLNAVAMEEMPKVVFLSHSTIENLTRDWVNTHSLTSEKTTCKGRGHNEAPACHQLHYNWDTCTEAPALAGTEGQHQRKGMGVAQCQADIGPQDAYKVIWHAVQWRIEEYAQAAGIAPAGVVALGEKPGKARIVETALRLIAGGRSPIPSAILPPRAPDTP